MNTRLYTVPDSGTYAAQRVVYLMESFTSMCSNKEGPTICHNCYMHAKHVQDGVSVHASDRPPPSEKVQLAAMEYFLSSALLWLPLKVFVKVVSWLVDCLVHCTVHYPVRYLLLLCIYPVNYLVQGIDLYAEYRDRIISSAEFH